MILPYLLVPFLVPVAPQTGEFGPRSDADVKQLLGDLNVMDKNAYYRAVDRLAAIGKRAVPTMLPYLRDSRMAHQMRAGILLVLQKMGRNAIGALPDVAKFLTHDNVANRFYALSIMEGTDPASAKYLDGIRDRMTDKNPRVRGLALKVTVQLAKDRAPLLAKVLDALDDEASDTRSFAMEALVLYYGASAAGAFDKIAEQLVHPEPRLVEQAKVTLASLGPAAVGRLIEMLDGKRGEKLRVPAADILGRVRPATRPQIDALVRVMSTDFKKDPIHDTARAALRSIAEPCVADLGKLLELGPEHAELVKAAIADLGTIGHLAHSQWKGIAAFLKHEDLAFRKAALKSLAKIRVEAALDNLLAAVDDPSEEIRVEAIAAISQIGNVCAPALPKFVSILSDGDRRFGHAIVNAFTVIGANAAPAVPKLIRLLGAEDRVVRARAADSLAAIGEPAIGPVLELLAGKPSGAQTRAALQVMVGLGPRAAAGRTALTKLLDSDDTLIRRDAAMGLARMGARSPEAAKKVRKLLRDPDRDTRIAGVTALAVVARGEPDVVDELIAVSKDGDDAVAWAAIEALGWPGNTAAVVPLTKILTHEDPFWRLRAVRTLGAIGPAAREALPHIQRQRSKERSSFVLREMESTLERITGRKRR